MSILKTDLLQTSSGGATTLTKQSAAKAWANYDTTGTTSIRDSFNHSSITDQNTGDTQLNFTNNLSSGNYSVTAMAGRAGAIASILARYNDNVAVPTSSLFRVQLIAMDTNHSGSDADRVAVSTSGDLA
tara:strand:+ start:492 stop:878 length:387 start_codon:yes stop_codon:yes gene_type:complete